MAKSKHVPFRADHVGSLLRPKELADARAAFKKGKLTRAALTKVEDKAIKDAVKLQQDVGLQVVTDGEFRRAYWHLDFLTGFKNIDEVVSPLKAKFHTHSGEIEAQPPTTNVVGKVSRPKGGIFVDHFKYLKSIAGKSTPKITIPSPSLTYFRGGRDTISKKAYPDVEDFFTDFCKAYNEEVQGLAKAGCKYLQIDDTVFSYVCDPSIVKSLAKVHTRSPDELQHLYARLINKCIEGHPKDMTITMHSCRGNFKSAWVAEGGYEPVADVLFNKVNATGYFLEWDNERAGDFKPLRWLPKGKTVVLGLVTTKLSKLETKDAIKRRIDQATKYTSLDQLALSPQCGFASTQEGNNVSLQQEMDKLRLVVEVAEEVWG